MNKFIITDIKDGYTLMYSGFNNIFHSVCSGEIVTIPNIIDIRIINYICNNLFPDADIKYADSKIIINNKNNVITIKVLKDSIIFGI